MGKLLGSILIKIAGRSGKFLRVLVTKQSVAKAMTRLKTMFKLGKSAPLFSRLPVVKAGSATTVIGGSKWAQVFSKLKGGFGTLISFVAFDAVVDAVCDRDDPNVAPTRRELLEVLRTTAPQVKWSENPDELYIQLNDVLDSGNVALVKALAYAFRQVGVEIAVAGSDEVQDSLAESPIGAVASMFLDANGVVDIDDMRVQAIVGDGDITTESSRQGFEEAFHYAKELKRVARVAGLSVSDLRDLQKMILTAESGDFTRAEQL